jgi:hypothetical protein
MMDMDIPEDVREVKRTIPQIRQRLHEIAVKLRDEEGLDAVSREIAELAEETKRIYGNRRAPNQGKPLTASKVAAVRRYAKRYPDASYTEIAYALDIPNIGRISDALTGIRGVDK